MPSINKGRLEARKKGRKRKTSTSIPHSFEGKKRKRGDLPKTTTVVGKKTPSRREID